MKLTENDVAIMYGHGWTQDGIDDILVASTKVIRDTSWVMLECLEGDLVILYPIAIDNKYPYKLWKKIYSYIDNNKRVAIPITFGETNTKSIRRATRRRGGHIRRLTDESDLLYFEKDIECHQ